MSPQAEHLAALGAAFAASAVATAGVRPLARRLDFVSRPRGERWSARPVPMGGGVGIYAGLAVGLYLLSPDLLFAATLVLLLGLVDDRRHLSPPAKLVVQTVAACWMVAAPLSGTPALLVQAPLVVAIPLTIGWYVGMANSLNLLDNMDGSAAGVSAVTALFLYVLAAAAGAPPGLALAAAATCGASAGFLVHNFPPARVFMGDAGSLLLGFALAGLAVHQNAARPAAGQWQGLAVLLFVLGAPLFDTVLVWSCRRAARRPFLHGGRDHAAHRLVALGLSERRTLAVLYGATAALGGVGVGVALGGVGLAVLLAVGGGIGLVLLGVFLGDVAVYRSPAGEAPPGPPPTVRRPARLLYGVELAVDVALLSAAWIGAYAARFAEADLPFYLSASALPALPFVIALKVAALLWFDLYRGFWRTIHFADLSSIIKAVTLGSVGVVGAATVLMRFEHFSRGVIAIDWLLSLAGVLASRSALRFLRDTLGRWGQRPRAVLLGPAPLLPWLRAAPELPCEVVEAVDGAPEDVLRRARELEASVVLVPELTPRDDPVRAALERAGLEVRSVTARVE